MELKLHSYNLKRFATSSFNRTFMELKLLHDATIEYDKSSFNRTFMELKWHKSNRRK